MGWRANKAWSDRFVPQIQQILAEHLITVAEPEEDAQHNTDLFTLKLPGQVRIACRVRRNKYLVRYPDEFTLRCSVPSGSETEIDKLEKGWGDLLFYGFANAEESALAAWFVGDLHVFREWLSAYRRAHGKWPCRVRKRRRWVVSMFAHSWLRARTRRLHATAGADGRRTKHAAGGRLVA